MKSAIILLSAIVIILSGMISYSIEYDKPIENIIELKTEFEQDNFIQGAHNEIVYSTNHGLKVPSIDYCNKVTGSSMQSTLFTGNTICFIKYNSALKSKLKEGMIISFEDKDSSATHRIKAIYSDYLLTQGDNSDHPETTEYEDIKGVGVVIILT